MYFKGYTVGVRTAPFVKKNHSFFSYLFRNQRDPLFLAIEDPWAKKQSFSFSGYSTSI